MKSTPKKIHTPAGIVWKDEDGRYHREDGPAMEFDNGEKSWWEDNKLHRIDVLPS